MKFPRLGHLRPLILMICVVFGGCFASYWTYTSAGGGNDAAMGEQHDTPYPQQDTFVMTQDVLRGDGVLFSVKPDNRIVTLWRDADVQAGIFGSIVGVHPQYRYDIEVVPTGPRTSRIIANLHAEDIPDSDLNSYMPTKRLNLFNKFDQLAAKLPPPSTTPREGGVNFALLPGEDLRGLAKRATGNQDNWRQIAQDNGLTSDSNLSGVDSVWVRNTLLKQNKGPSPAP